MNYFDAAFKEGYATGIDITLEPPGDGADSDVDNDPSEDVVEDGEEDVEIPGTKLLAQPPFIELTNRNSHLEPCALWSVPVFTPRDTQTEAEFHPLLERKNRLGKSMYVWEKYNIEDSSSVQIDSPPEVHNPSVLDMWSHDGLTPVDVFKVFWDLNLMATIARETNRYHYMKFGKKLSVTIEELYQVLGIFLLSGYRRVPDTRLYWSNEADVQCLAVIQSGLELDRFEAIVESLHFADNLKKPAEDRIYKVRPLIDHFNRVFMNLAQPFPMTWVVGEVLEPYYDHRGGGRFFQGKPVQFGYKLWCFCSSEGLLMSFGLRDGKKYEEDQRASKSVVETLAKVVVPRGSSGYIDHSFMTLPLLESFRKADINLMGTVRQERVKDIPQFDTRKRERGSAEIFTDRSKGITMCQWNDNTNITLATNQTDTASLSMSTCRRWSKKEKETMSLPQPVMVQRYNRSMRGLELFDWYRAKYRIAFRKRVWYFPLFRFLLNASIVNAWLMYAKIHRISELSFLRKVVLTLLKPSEESCISALPKMPPPMRFDGVDHNIEMGNTPRHCGVCQKKVKSKCTKCNVALHIRCWVRFHTKD